MERGDLQFYYQIMKIVLKAIHVIEGHVWKIDNLKEP
jgi:hypothetical protein